MRQIFLIRSSQEVLTSIFILPCPLVSLFPHPCFVGKRLLDWEPNLYPLTGMVPVFAGRFSRRSLQLAFPSCQYFWLVVNVRTSPISEYEATQSDDATTPTTPSYTPCRYPTPLPATPEPPSPVFRLYRIQTLEQ